MPQPWNVRSPQTRDAAEGFYASEADDSRPAYATTCLSFRPTGAEFEFAPGDRVEEILPADVLAACVARGEVAFENPETRKVKS